MMPTSQIGIFLLFVAASAATDGPCLRIGRLNERYLRDNPVSFVVTNTGSRTVRLFTEVQSWDEDEGLWSRFPFGLNTGSQTEVPTIFNLAHGEKAEYTYDVRKIRLPPLPPGVALPHTPKLAFRFAVFCLDSKTDREVAVFYSDRFVIEEPYGTVK